MEANERVEGRLMCINCAVEESSLGERQEGLHQQDQFIQSRFCDGDHLVVSVGGNDVVLKRTVGTVWNTLLLMVLSPQFMIRRGWAPGLGYFKNLFGSLTQKYIEQLVGDRTPARYDAASFCFALAPS